MLSLNLPDTKAGLVGNLIYLNAKRQKASEHLEYIDLIIKGTQEKLNDTTRHTEGNT
jgi:hypothetical protein